MEQKDRLRFSQIEEFLERIDRGLAEAHVGELADGEIFRQGLPDYLDSQDALLAHDGLF
jgi:hypothetical protein